MCGVTIEPVDGRVSVQTASGATVEINESIVKVILKN
jgi:hypothetical protein